MSQNKLLSLLGLARRAGMLSLGHDPAIEAMQNRRTELVLVACDLSKRTLKGVCAVAEQTQTTLLSLRETIEEVTAALGRRVGVIAVNDAGFANKMRAEYKIDTMIRRNRSYDEEI